MWAMKLGMSILAGQVLWQGAAWFGGPGTGLRGSDSRRTCCSHCARKWRSELPSGQAAARPCVGQFEREFVERRQVAGIAAADA